MAGGFHHEDSLLSSGARGVLDCTDRAGAEWRFGVATITRSPDDAAMAGHVAGTGNKSAAGSERECRRNETDGGPALHSVRKCINADADRLQADSEEHGGGNSRVPWRRLSDSLGRPGGHGGLRLVEWNRRNVRAGEVSRA